jgi:hypothetical protein
MNILKFQAFYHVNHRRFNVGLDSSGKSSGVCVDFDEITGKKYITGSGDNVKHCVKMKMSDSDFGGYAQIPKEFIKKLSKKDSDKEQGNVSVEVRKHMFNPMLTFGGWDNAVDDTDKNYRTAALKSSIVFGYFVPLNTNALFVEENRTVTCNGTENDTICVMVEKDGKKIKCDTIEKLAEIADMPLEECEVWLKKRKSNIGQKEPTVTGIYVFDISIDLDRLCTYSVNKLNLTKAEIEDFVKNGFTKVIISGETYLRLPNAERVKFFENFVKAIHNFEFESNNSSAGNQLKLLRTAFGLNCAQNVADSTIPIRNFKKDEDSFKIIDGYDNVHSYNTPSIKGHYNGKANTDMHAVSHSIEKMVEIGKNVLMQ